MNKLRHDFELHKTDLLDCVDCDRVRCLTHANDANDERYKLTGRSDIINAIY